MIDIGCFDDTVLDLSIPDDGQQYFCINGNKTHFRVVEFASKDGSNRVKVSVKLIRLLEHMRVLTGQPIHINSGYRTPEHNAKVGGSPKSQHLTGKAADIVIGAGNNIGHALKAAILAESLGATGIGLYNTFTHIDVRDNKSFWDNTGKGLLQNGSFHY